jgi:hypothetical protein
VDQIVDNRRAVHWGASAVVWKEIAVATEENRTVESILAGAKHAGLPLTQEEAADLVKGVARMRDMARTVRELLESTTEPAPVFSPGERRTAK